MGVEMNVCPNCNWGKLEKVDGKLRCPACGAEFNDETSEIITHLNEEQLEKMRKYRVLLDRTLREENISLDKVRGYCDNILKENPDDLIANFYNDLCDSNRNTAIQAIDNITERIDDLTEDAVDLICEVLIKSLKQEYINCVNTFIQKAYNGKNNPKYGDYMRRYEDEAKKIDEGIFVPNMPRDIFVLYSSKDGDLVRDLVKYLEVDNGLRCFFAQRNLQHGIGSPENYEAYLKEAIRNCKCFVYVSTPNSRSMVCDAFRKERGWIEADSLAKDKPRIEYRPLPNDNIDKNNNFDYTLREFFRSTSYCVTKDEVAKRVLKYITAAEPETAEAKPQKNKEAVKKVEEKPKAATDSDAFYIEGKTLVSVITSRLTDEVVIPDGVKKIAPNAFANCSRIGSVYIPDSVTEIGEKAFENCQFLRKVRLPKGLERIAPYTFKHCVSLDDIRLPESLKIIDECALKECYALTDIKLPHGLTTIGEEAFDSDGKLGGISVPDSVTSIGNFAFAETGVEYVRFPNKLKTIPKEAFESCKNLIEVIVPSSVETVSESAFAGCESLRQINIPNPRVKIAPFAFKDCASLGHVTVPGGLKNFEINSFEGCEKLAGETKSALLKKKKDIQDAIEKKENRLNAIVSFAALIALVACVLSFLPVAQGISFINLPHLWLRILCAITFASEIFAKRSKGKMARHIITAAFCLFGGFIGGGWSVAVGVLLALLHLVAAIISKIV